MSEENKKVKAKVFTLIEIPNICITQISKFTIAMHHHPSVISARKHGQNYELKIDNSSNPADYQNLVEELAEYNIEV